MSKTAKGLVEYCRAQMGRPYWMGTFGQIATASLYSYNKGRLPQYYTASDFPAQYGQRVHDCIGLIKGYLWSDGPDAVPQYASGCPDINEAQMLQNCSEKGDIGTMPDEAGVLVFYSGHVGVYVGGGKVIEARGHAYGVVETAFAGRGWTSWGKCPYIKYEPEQPENDEPSDWAKAACDWAVKEGYIKGDGAGNFRWKDTVTREEFVTILHRYHFGG